MGHFAVILVMPPTINLSMFQCMMDTTECGVNLKVMWNVLNTNQKSYIQLYAYPPGSIGKKMTNDMINTHQIGSIAFKIEWNGLNISFLMFDKKVKISGGLSKLDPQDLSTKDLWMFIQNILIVPILSIYVHADYANDLYFKSGMFNANIRTNKKLNIHTYVKLLQELQKSRNCFKNIRFPLMYTDASRQIGKCKGRLCAVKIISGGTIMFDHSCNIQTFGYRSLEALYADIQTVWGIINKFN